MKKMVLVAALVISMAGCSTPYGDHGALNWWMGGVTATRLSEDTYSVYVTGNAYTSMDKVQQFVMRKAAEITVQAGFDWFAVGNEKDASFASSFTTSAHANSYTTGQATAVGNFAFGSATTTTTYTPPQTYTFIHPGMRVLVKMGKGAVPWGAFDAKRTLAFLAPAKH